MIQKLFRKGLQLVYRFDKWHISPLHERPYAIDIIQYCNQYLNRNDFAEIGCGLGDIIRNVDFKRRTGFDIDEKVLKAAQFLSGRKDINYQVFRFPESALTGRYDILTLVNWIHHIPPETLRDKVSEYFNHHLHPQGVIIVDTVQDPAYKFNHQIDFLSNGLNCSVDRLGKYARQREVWAIKRIN